MADPHALDHEPLIDHLVKDPVVTNTNPIDRILPRNRNTPWWPRITNEKVDGSTDA